MPDEPKTSLCKGPNCGATLYWAELNGKMHPFDADGKSHFRTCVDANKVRKKKSNPPKRLRGDV